MRHPLPIGLAALLFLAASCRQEDVQTRRARQMAALSELGTVEYTVRKVIKADDPGPWYKIGDRKILFTCTAHLKAGIDMSGFRPEDLQESLDGSGLTVTLPHARLLSLDMPPDEIRLVYTQVTFFRSDFTARERNDLLRQGEQEIRAEVPSLGILAEAEAGAEQTLRALLTPLGYESIHIRFR